MKIRILSDLHLEFHRDKGANFIKSLETNDTDVLVLAGDISTSEYIEEALNQFASKFPKVLYVHGNHEYYKNKRDDVVSATIRAVLKHNSNLYWLNRNAVTIDGVRFVGTTLWFPSNKQSIKLKGYINDFYCIEDCDPWAFEENKKNIKFLIDEVRKGDVVITHHLPSFKSVHRMYKNDPMNCYFVCEMDDLIIEKQPALWIHGHTHFSMDYKIENTRIVCNPYGYEGAGNTNRNFDKNFVAEIFKE
jgi:predicted phosphodiesterase